MKAETDISETSTKPDEISVETPDKCFCGVTREARIVCPNNYNCSTYEGQIPWQAAIVKTGRTQPFCGASVISDRYVLTAAHCLRGKTEGKIQVILGDHDWTKKSDGQDERFSVSEIRRHPLFNKAAEFDYDFALLKLDRQIKFNQHIRPVCLPDNRDGQLIGAVAEVSGWGVQNPKKLRSQSKDLKRVYVTVLTNTDCESKYPINPVTENMICAATRGGDACFGDSGGPMTIKTDGGTGVAVLEGVISWGKSCADRRWPGVYASVRKVRKWIDDHTRDSNFCQRKERRLRFREDKALQF